MISLSESSIVFNNEDITITLRNGTNDNGATIQIKGLTYVKEKVYAAYHVYAGFYKNNDVDFPDKSVLQFIVGRNYLPGDPITVHNTQTDDEFTQQML